ncbi:uncharacterized protein LOC134855848 [Symsagittifera roscoffensis]|uniref:uncharacterized protein LOC134855848 n=1 Tax=Symsagittifera roscoffensis TaxID=84072 RepID=UPI00307C8241
MSVRAAVVTMCFRSVVLPTTTKSSLTLLDKCQLKSAYAVARLASSTKSTDNKPTKSDSPPKESGSEDEGKKYFNWERDEYDEFSYYDYEEDMKHLRLPQPSPYS